MLGPAAVDATTYLPDGAGGDGAAALGATTVPTALARSTGTIDPLVFDSTASVLDANEEPLTGARAEELVSVWAEPTAFNVDEDGDDAVVEALCTDLRLGGAVTDATNNVNDDSSVPVTSVFDTSFRLFDAYDGQTDYRGARGGPGVPGCEGRRDGASDGTGTKKGHGKR